MLRETSISRGVLVLITIAQILTSPESRHSEEAKAYLNRSLDLMQQYSLHRKKIDWPPFRREILEYARGATTTQETYPAIVFACTRLKDLGCGLREPSGTPAVIESKSLAIEMAAEEAVHGRKLTSLSESPFLNRRRFSLVMLTSGDRHYAYVVIPVSEVSDATYGDPQIRHQWAQELFSLIAKGSQLGAQGWILDLRGNTGGYTSPVLAGLQSILGDHKILSSRTSEHRYTTFIRAGAILQQVAGAAPYVDEHVEPYTDLHQDAAPTAVLIDRRTEDGGVTLAFRGRKNTCFIGQRTAGLAESGTVWNLSDGATLTVPTALQFDRNGEAYPEGVEPDLEVSNPKTVVSPADDPVIVAAEGWLQSAEKRGAKGKPLSTCP